MLTVGSQPADEPDDRCCRALGVLALLALVGGPLLMWLSQTGRGPQWLRR